MHKLRWVSGAVLIGVLVAGWLAWRQPPGPAPETAPAGLPLARPALPALMPVPAPAQVQAPAAADEPPLNVQVERLLATRNPADAYRAYWLLADCAAYNRNGDRLVFDQEEARHPKPGTLPGFRGMSDEEKRHAARTCSGMTERERQSRIDYLAIAAKAGVPGAAINFAIEGPFGDPSALQTRPDDPLVQAWRETARAQLTQAAELGADLGAIAYLADAYAGNSMLAAQDPLLAYRYRLAASFIDEDMLGPGDPLPQALVGQRQEWSRLIEEFSPDRRAAELAAARRIAERARTLREQAAREASPPGR